MNAVQVVTRPPINDALSIVLGDQVLALPSIHDALRVRGWVPDARHPVEYIRHVLSTQTKLFEYLGRGRFRNRVNEPNQPVLPTLKTLMQEVMQGKIMSPVDILTAVLARGWTTKSDSAGRINGVLQDSSTFERVSFGHYRLLGSGVPIPEPEKPVVFIVRRPAKLEDYLAVLGTKTLSCKEIAEKLQRRGCSFSEGQPLKTIHHFLWNNARHFERVSRGKYRTASPIRPV